MSVSHVLSYYINNPFFYGVYYVYFTSESLMLGVITGSFCPTESEENVLISDCVESVLLSLRPHVVH